jgi:hypothetical protein
MKEKFASQKSEKEEGERGGGHKKYMGPFAFK